MSEPVLPPVGERGQAYQQVLAFIYSKAMTDWDLLTIGEALDKVAADARRATVERIRSAVITTRGGPDNVEAYLWRILNSEQDARP